MPEATRNQSEISFCSLSEDPKAVLSGKFELAFCTRFCTVGGSVTSKFVIAVEESDIMRRTSNGSSVGSKFDLKMLVDCTNMPLSIQCRRLFTLLGWRLRNPNNCQLLYPHLLTVQRKCCRSSYERYAIPIVPLLCLTAPRHNADYCPSQWVRWCYTFLRHSYFLS